MPAVEWLRLRQLIGCNRRWTFPGFPLNIDPLAMDVFLGSRAPLIDKPMKIVPSFAVRFLALGALSAALFLPSQGSARPLVNSFNPTRGAPGSSVRVFGTGFTAQTLIRFNGTAAISQTISATEIAATVPLDATSGPISAEDFSGSSTSRDSFLVAPRIISFTPGRGLSGTLVTIDGANFLNATSVTFNGLASGNMQVTSDSQIRAVVPNGNASGPIRVATPIGTALSSSNFLVTAGPIIDSFFPERGVAGTVVSIFGQRFNGAFSVRFNGVASTDFQVVADSQINARVPAGAGTGPISIQNGVGTGVSGIPFIISNAPVVREFSPLAANPGSVIAIFGENFVAGGTVVQFNGSNSPSVVVVAPTQINAMVPSNALSGPIRVVTAQGSGLSTQHFTVLGGPLISGFTPSRADVGSVITLSGANFFGATAVIFHSNRSANFNVTSDSQIQAQVPLGAVSGLIRVVTPRGTGVSTQSFTVISGPVIDGFSPRMGLPGDTIILSGVNFTGATNVFFNAVPVFFSVTADSQILATVPTNATTGPIRVDTALGTTVSASNFVVTPIITSCSPTNGPFGSTVVINGRNFQGTTAVKFNQAAAQFTLVSPQQINVVVPSNAPNGSISLQTEAGIVASVGRFLVTPEVDIFRPPVGPGGATVRIFGVGFSDVLSVKFSGINSPSVVAVSPNELRARVPDNAVSGPIQVTTAGGQDTSSTDFLVGVAADLEVRGTAVPEPVVTETPLTYNWVVTNQGPSSATGVIFSNELPENVTFVSARSSLGRCHRTNNAVVCVLGTMPAGSFVNLTIIVTPHQLGAMTSQSTVSGNQLDFDEANNFLELVSTAVNETNKPAVTIAAPLQNARLTNEMVLVRGTARDDRGVAAVYVQVNSNDFVLASGTTSWSVTVPLSPGTNILSARSVDLAGNESALAQRTVFHLVKSPLTIEVVGSGQVSPNLNGRLLEIGKRYVVNALPGRGFVFEQWSGDVTGQSAKLEFLMASNLLIRASFIPNPFVHNNGSYVGLFQPSSGAVLGRSGFVSLNLTDRGTFSGRLQTSSNTHSFSGRFTAQGQSTITLRGTGTNFWTLALTLDFDLALINGTLSAPDFIAGVETFRVVRAGFDRPLTVVPGKWTFLVQSHDDSTNQPGGYGLGAVTLSGLGGLRLVGNLGDGSVISQSVPVSVGGRWPFFQKLYGGQGMAIGWQQFSGPSSPELSGTVRWVKSAISSELFYPEGFTNDLQLTGSVYLPPTAGQTVLSNVNAEVVIHGGNFNGYLTNQVTLLPNHRIAVNGGGIERLSISFIPSSGIFSGTFLHPVLRRTTAFKGVVIQDENFGGAYFKGTNQTGYLLLRGQ